MLSKSSAFDYIAKEGRDDYTVQQGERLQYHILPHTQNSTSKFTSLSPQNTIAPVSSAECIAALQPALAHVCPKPEHVPKNLNETDPTLKACGGIRLMSAKESDGFASVISTAAQFWPSKPHWPGSNRAMCPYQMSRSLRDARSETAYLSAGNCEGDDVC